MILSDDNPEPFRICLAQTTPPTCARLALSLMLGEVWRQALGIVNLMEIKGQYGLRME